MIVEEGTIKSSFRGFRNRDTIFEFAGGGVWQQAEYKYLYHYAYRPAAKVVQDGGRHLLYVEGIDDAVEVRRASIVQRGSLNGAFKGFKDCDTVYEFVGGRKWAQAEYKYVYHYAYRPSAMVIDAGGAYMLRVDGMNEPVRVRRA